ncbi:autotransporter outer membrane beta-barrel domain-containing protein [Pseudomonas atagonensis]|uniref:autotransporter outer membrane beta-barrel domain-containing protein n=1 Tax=Pseudomonas atagonensis TaxID=2609964 RepID=UPI00140CE116|nr:autotransporter outer membrane beta-barrel domain-containing protein [Pseudomonas atagonensis]
MRTQHTYQAKKLALSIALTLGCTPYAYADQTPAPTLNTQGLIEILDTFINDPTTIKHPYKSRISATDGVSLHLDDRNDLVSLQSRGSFAGLVDGGGGTNVMQLDAAKGGTLGKTSNFDGLEVKQGAWVRSGDGDFNIGVLVRPKASLTNEGNITGQALTEGTLVNNGAIVGDATALAGGVLTNNGLIGGNVTVHKNGQFAGSGAMTDLNVHGLLSINQVHGAPAVKGDLNLSQTAVLAYALDHEGKSPTIQVDGVARLGDATLKLVTAGDYPQSSQHTLLTAGKVEGRFATVENNLAFMTPELQYDEQKVGLTYSRNGVELESVAITDNGRAVAESIEEPLIPQPTPVTANRPSPTASPAMAAPQSSKPANAAVVALLTSDKNTAPVAIEQLAAGSNANLAKATLSSSAPVSASMLSAMRQLDKQPGAAYHSGNSPRQAAGDHKSGRVWVQGLGHGGKVDRDFDSTLKHATQGLVLGADWRLDEQWHLGLLAGKSQTSLDARQYDGDLDSWHLGAYAVRQEGPLAWRLGATYSSHDGSSKRRVAFNGFKDRLEGDYNASTQQAFAEVGFNLGRHNATLEPFASLGYQRYQRDSYKEKGGDAALKVHGQTRDNLSSTFGVRTAKINRLNNGMSLTPRFSAGWKHTFGELDSDTRQQLVKGGKRFEVAGAALDRNSLTVDAGLDLGLSANHTLGVGLTGEMGTDSRNHGVMGQWRMAF